MKICSAILISVLVLFSCKSEQKLKPEDTENEASEAKIELTAMEDASSSCYMNASGEMIWTRNIANGEVAHMNTKGVISNYENVNSGNSEVSIKKGLNKIDVKFKQLDSKDFEKVELYSGKLNPISPLIQYLAIKKDKTFSIGGAGKETFSGKLMVENDSNFIFQVTTPFKEVMKFRKRKNSLLKTSDDFKIIVQPILEFKQNQRM